MDADLGIGVFGILIKNDVCPRKFLGARMDLFVSVIYLFIIPFLDADVANTQYPPPFLHWQLRWSARTCFCRGRAPRWCCAAAAAGQAARMWQAQRPALPVCFSQCARRTHWCAALAEGGCLWCCWWWWRRWWRRLQQFAVGESRRKGVKKIGMISSWKQNQTKKSTKN
jgi:hypothetical protein